MGILGSYRYRGGFFFFKAKDGIRDWSVTGVQTCALPIFCLFTIDADNGLRHRAKPSPVRRKSIDANRFAPSSIVIAAIAGMATLLDDDPGVDSEDPAPAYRARGINSDQGIWMLQGLWQESDA